MTHGRAGRENSGAAGFAKINATAIEAAPPSSHGMYRLRPSPHASPSGRSLHSPLVASLAAGRAAALVFGRTASVRLRGRVGLWC